MYLSQSHQAQGVGPAGAPPSSLVWRGDTDRAQEARVAKPILVDTNLHRYRWIYRVGYVVERGTKGKTFENKVGYRGWSRIQRENRWWRSGIQRENLWWWSVIQKEICCR